MIESQSRSLTRHTYTVVSLRCRLANLRVSARLPIPHRICAEGKPRRAGYETPPAARVLNARRACSCSRHEPLYARPNVHVYAYNAHLPCSKSPSTRGPASIYP